MKAMKNIFVFDIDGTLANNDHRKHFVERPPGERDWGQLLCGTAS